MAHNKIPGSYAYEPRSNIEAYVLQVPQNNEENEDLVDLPNNVNRLADTQWCVCKNCHIETLSSIRECICCHEIEFCQTYNPNSCITMNPRFHTICTDNEALETVLSGLAGSRANALNAMRIRHINSRLALVLLTLYGVTTNVAIMEKDELKIVGFDLVMSNQ